MVQDVVLRGSDSYGGRVPSAPVGHLLTLMPEVVRQCVSMAFQRRSKARGRPPQWLVAASDLRVLKISGKAETTVRFDLPRLGEAAPDAYEQSEFWPSRPEPEDTGFDLLGDVLSDVSVGKEDSERFDQNLLWSVAGLRHVLDGSFDEVRVSGRRYPIDSPAVIDAVTISAAEELYSKTPAPTRVRLVGVLDALRISTRTFALRLDDGNEVRGVLSAGDFSRVLDAFGMKLRVLVRGDAVFRPSGQLLLVDADDVTLAADESPIWSRLPQGLAGDALQPGLHRRQTHTSGLAAIVGRWPGSESDEEIEAALKELR